MREQERAREKSRERGSETVERREREVNGGRKTNKRMKRYRKRERERREKRDRDKETKRQREREREREADNEKVDGGYKSRAASASPSGTLFWSQCTRGWGGGRAGEEGEGEGDIPPSAAVCDLYPS